MTFTVGFERAGYSEIDVAAESAAAIGVEHVTKVVTAERVRRGDPAGRLVPRRPGGRPGPRAAVLHRPRGPQARQGRALRRGRRRAVRRLHHLPGAALARGVRQAAHRHAARAGRGCRRGCPTGCGARTSSDGARSRSSSATTATPGSSATTSWASCERPRPGPLARGGHRGALRADPRGRLRRRHRDAVRRPVHLAARRHPGQGRQDDDGQLAGAAGPVPRPRGLQGREHAAGGPAGDQGDDEVRAAPGPGADRAAARARPAQARLPRADPALAGRGPARLGAGRSSRRARPTSGWTSGRCSRCWPRTGTTSAAARRSTTRASCGRCWCS